MMNIYNYNPNTGELVSSTHAIPNPLEINAFLTPANATTLVPPNIGNYEKAIFNNGVWTVVPDWRGVPLYSKIDGSPLVINTLTITPDSINATPLVPPTGINQSAVWANTTWILRPDWRETTLYSTDTAMLIKIDEAGVTPDSINATPLVPPTGINQSAVWVNGAWTLEPDYRSVQLYSTLTSFPVRTTAIGQTPDSINATPLVPPTGINQSAVWVNGAWTLEPDYRSVQLYLKSTGEGTSATAIGQTPDSIGATVIAPPSGTNQLAVWVNGAWILEPDYRKVQLYLKSTGKKVVETVTIGQTPDSIGATVIAPPDNNGTWIFTNDTWVVNTPAFTEMLLQYGEMKQAQTLAAGININVGTVSTPINILCDGMDSTRASISLLALWGQLNPTSTDAWKDNNRIFTTLTGAEFVTLATKVGSWIKNVYAFEATLEANIASGVITTTQAIDALVWPVE